MDDPTSIRAEITAIRQSLAAVQESMSQLASTLLQRLARLEERDLNTTEAVNRAFETISKHDSRLQALERSQPLQKMTSTWVINAAWACVGVVAALVAKRLIGIL